MRPNVKTILACPNCGLELHACAECGDPITEKTEFRCRTVNFGEYRHLCKTNGCDECG